MQRCWVLACSLLLLIGCAGERIPGDGTILSMTALPAEYGRYDLTWEWSPLPLVQEGRDEAEREALQASRDAIIDAWTEKLRTMQFAHMTRTSERAIISRVPSIPSLGGAHPRVKHRSCARAEMYMSEDSFFTAGWICHPDGRFAAATPTMKLFYEDDIVVERAYDAKFGGYTTTFAAPAHAWGTDDFHAMGHWHGCMIGDCAQTWLGESRTRDFYIARLAECVLLPGTHDFGGSDCHVLRWEVGGDTWRMRHDYYFNSHGVVVGRDARQWNKGSSGDSYIIERSTNSWTFHDELPEQFHEFRALLRRGLDESAMANAAGRLPVIGNLAPDVELRFLNGTKTTLRSMLVQGPVIVDFWATWCGPCHRLMPSVKQIAEDYRSRGVQVVAIAVKDQEDRVRKYVAEHAPMLPAVLDSTGALAAAFAVRGIPQIVIVDQTGIIRAIHHGASDDFDERLRQQLAELLAARTAGP